jgi:cytochrome c553
MMKKIVFALAAVAVLTQPVWAANVAGANIVAGKAKAEALCAGCHGNEFTPGLFFTLQLAGRNADKLALKTNKYRTGKLFTPLMAVSMIGLTEGEVSDISAYYASIKPAFNLPLFQIKADD